MSGRYVTVKRPTLPVILTRQQAHILCEFGDPIDPYSQSSDTLATCGVREWPTCDNLVAAGLIVRVAWEGGLEGWLYDITPEGCGVLSALHEMGWR